MWRKARSSQLSWLDASSSARAGEPETRAVPPRPAEPTRVTDLDTHEQNRCLLFEAFEFWGDLLGSIIVAV